MRSHLLVEGLEPRILMADAMAAPEPDDSMLLDPLTIPQFVNALPNALDPSFVYQPSSRSGGVAQYAIGMYKLEDQDLGLGLGRLTDVFAYGTSAATATYPGRSFITQRNTPIEVTWVNNLPNQHLLDVDPTLLDRMQMYSSTMGFHKGVPAVVHLHGGHTDSQSDGLPEQWYTRDDSGDGVPDMYGMDYEALNLGGIGSTFHYGNDQDATTLWYHDHAMGLTRLNAYAGLAGFYFIRDEWDTGLANNPLGLPAGPYEIPLVIQDKQFLPNGDLYFESAPVIDDEGNVVTETGTLPETFGDVILVNGKAWPYLQVEARRYRFHILNGSDSRFYTLNNNMGAKMWIVGDDQGLLNNPISTNNLVVAPGERYDVVIDFTGFEGRTITMFNSAKTPFPDGERVEEGTTDRIMQFRVVAATSPDTSVVMSPTVQLRRGTSFTGAELPITSATPAAAAAQKRPLALFEMMDEYGRMEPMLGTTAGFNHFMDPITENPALGATEVWEIYNNTPDAHPIHLHLVKFQLVDRQGFRADVDEMTGEMTNIRLDKKVIAPTAAEMSWQDTIIMYPGEVTRVVATFDLPGKYVWHCHILSHEEHDMMRPFYVGQMPPASGPLSMPMSISAGVVSSAPLTSVLAEEKPDLLR